MAGSEGDRRTRSRVIKALLGITALATVLAGLLLYSFAEQLGISEGSAAVIATAFLVAGFLDYILMRAWDRIYPPE
ncbi:MAG: hypothetical protein Kow0032_28650 [Methyloligellaceae bacterium]